MTQDVRVWGVLLILEGTLDAILSVLGINPGIKIVLMSSKKRLKTRFVTLIHTEIGLADLVESEKDEKRKEMLRKI